MFWDALSTDIEEYQKDNEQQQHQQHQMGVRVCKREWELKRGSTLMHLYWRVRVAVYLCSCVAVCLFVCICMACDR